MWNLGNRRTPLSPIKDILDQQLSYKKYADDTNLLISVKYYPNLLEKSSALLNKADGRFYKNNLF